MKVKHYLAAAALLLTMATAAQAADTDTPMVAYTTADGTPHDPIDFTSLTSSTAKGKLVDAVTLTATGTWTSVQVNALSYALRPTDGGIYSKNSTLVTANLGDAAWSGSTSYNASSLFGYCEALTTVTLPADGTSIKTSFADLFNGCKVLQSVTNLDKFTNVSSFGNTFHGCEALQTVTLPAGSSADATPFNSAFDGCAALERIENLDLFTKASSFSNTFYGCEVLKDISLDLEQGEALAIIGSSGSGKTTLLRCLNFLERPDTGVIKVNGETMWDAADPATQKESEIRKKRLHFGLVFQNFNLFPQYTALQNVMLAGELLAKERPEYQANKKAIHAELEQQARELLAQMGLSERAGHYPHQLSGGQQQRVAIARALALHPDILCFDEPTSALDPELTGEVLKVLRDLADRKTTMIIVTHEMHFARDVADRILFMDGGVVVEEGSAKQLIDHPREERTRQFLAHYSE